METEIIRLVCLVVAIWFTFVNIGKAVAGQGVPALNVLIMASAIVGFMKLSNFI
jgi:hypothetical protein